MDEADKPEDAPRRPRRRKAALATSRCGAKHQAPGQGDERTGPDPAGGRREGGEVDAPPSRPSGRLNAQTRWTPKTHPIVAFDLTNEGNDQRLLYPMAEQGKQALGAASVTVVADVGYSNGEHGERCEEAQITAIVPRAQTVNPGGESDLDRDRFAYYAASDSYQCPAAQTLRVGRVSNAKETKQYWNSKACRACALKPQCTKAARRTIVRSFHEDAREAMHRRATSDSRWMRLRKSVVEHPFGTMKWMLGHPRFLIWRTAQGESGIGARGARLQSQTGDQPPRRASLARRPARQARRSRRRRLFHDRRSSLKTQSA